MIIMLKHADGSRLTFSEAAVIWGLGVKFRNVVLRNTQQRLHEVREIHFTQDALAPFVKELMGKNKNSKQDLLWGTGLKEYKKIREGPYRKRSVKKWFKADQSRESGNAEIDVSEVHSFILEGKENVKIKLVASAQTHWKKIFYLGVEAADCDGYALVRQPQNWNETLRTDLVWTWPTPVNHSSQCCLQQAERQEDCQVGGSRGIWETSQDLTRLCAKAKVFPWQGTPVGETDHPV